MGTDTPTSAASEAPDARVAARRFTRAGGPASRRP